MKKYSLLLAVLLAINLILSLLVWVGYGQINNNLNNNGKWVSTKLNLDMSVYGSNEYFYDRPTLSYNRLDLSAYHGYQEILTKKKHPLKIIDFDLYLGDQSYFYLVYNKDPEQYMAVRLSNNTEYPTAVLAIKESGEFISVSPIETSTWAPDTWHHAQLVFDKNSLSIVVDRKTIINIQTSVPENQQFGFRGSSKLVLIDNVIARNSKGDVVFGDDFSYRDKDMAVKFLGILTVISLLEGGVFWIMFRVKKSVKKALFAAIILGVNLLTAAAIAEGYLWLWVLKSYPNYNSPLNRLVNTMTFRKQTDKVDWANEYNKKLVSSYTNNDRKKILFIGTSQMWGAGAEKEGQTMVRVFEAKVGSGYQVMNASIYGLDSSSLLEYYRTSWIDFGPKLVVIDLSNNDIDPEVFERNLGEFVKLNKQRNIATIFVLEANSPEVTPGELPLHAIMEKVALEENVQLIDLHQYLKGKKGAGIIWWDNVHLTSFGQQLAGEFIYESIKNRL